MASGIALIIFEDGNYRLELRVYVVKIVANIATLGLKIALRSQAHQ
jgi:hypothetical protein